MFDRLMRLLVLPVLLLAAPAASAAPAIGAPAPGFSLPDSTGEIRALADYRGKVVVLEWTNHQCPFTVKHYVSGNMQALQKDATEAGVVWLSVISSAPGRQGWVDGPEADHLTRARGAHPSAVLLDPEGTVGHLYGARTTPHMFVIDAAGTLVYMGGIDDIRSTDPADIPRARNHVRAALADLAAHRPVAVPVTPPYGCSVKYR